MQYRKDIQILRGISVLLVVLFHLEITQFKSGFLGVDIFFVISGFLMAYLYKPENKLLFFNKRALRLLPAYFAIMLATLIASTLITSPTEYREVLTQSFWGLFLSSNLGFWSDNAYFDKSAFKPLLHLWSLGVEIQFYLIIPILHCLFSKSKFFLPIIGLGSLLACFYIVGVSPKTSFFIMPFRLWQFLAGYGVALFLIRNNSSDKYQKSILGLISLFILIILTMISLDGKALGFMHGHPGLRSLLITISTCIILATGLPKSFENLKISNALEILGKYSYSIYLVHFPLIVLWLYKPFSGTILKPDTAIKTLAMTTFIVLGTLILHHLVESPFRSSRKSIPLMITLIILISIIGPLGNYFQRNKFSEREMLAYNAWIDRDTYRCGKLNRLISPFSKSCEITNRMTNPASKVLLVGNSHADSIKATFASVANSLNISVRFLIENTPLMKGGMNVESLIKEAKLYQIEHIVLHYSNGAIDINTIKEVSRLAEVNNIKVSFIMPVPTWPESVPQILIKELTNKSKAPITTKLDYERNTKELTDNFNNNLSYQLKIYHIADYYCTDKCHLANSTGKPYYFDDGHLTLTGSELLRNTFLKILTN